MSFSDPNLQLPVQEGDIVDGKYRVESVLGVGGMGAVLAATHLQLGHRVAIKLLLSGPDTGPVARERFLREARAAATLRSEHVARVSDVGTFPDGTPFMVLEYLDGQDLGDLVERGGPLPIALAVDYVLQACDAVIEAHANGLVHRDLKPQNLFLTRRPNGTPLVKVLDFGISKQTAPTMDSGALTRTSDVVGSPLFMSPEQIRNAKDVDVRTDIWALGVILYELIGGRVPFEATTLPQLCSMVLEQEARSLREIRQEVPAELDAVILRCLQKRPEDRYPDVQSLMLALLPFGGAEEGADGESPFASTLTPGALVGLSSSRKSGARRVLSEPPLSAPKTLSSSSRSGAQPAVSDMPPGRRTEDPTSSPALRSETLDARNRSRTVLIGLSGAVALIAVVAVVTIRGDNSGTPAPAAKESATTAVPSSPAPAVSSTPASPLASSAPSASAIEARTREIGAATAELKTPRQTPVGATATQVQPPAATATQEQPPAATATAVPGGDMLPDRRK